MSGSVAPVLARIASIQSRFGTPGSPVAGGGVSSSDFAAAFNAATAQVDATAAAQAKVAAATVMTPPVRTPGTSGAVVASTPLATRTAAWTSVAGSTGVPATSAGVVVAAGAGATGSVSASVPYAAEFEAAGARHGVPGEILAAIGWVESRYQPDAVSPAGAIGMMQLMPFVADELGVDATDPVQSIDGAARLLASHFDRFGSWDLAIASYFSGAGAVSRAGNAIPSEAAQRYVQKVMERMATT